MLNANDLRRELTRYEAVHAIPTLLDRFRNLTPEEVKLMRGVVFPTYDEYGKYLCDCYIAEVDLNIGLTGKVYKVGPAQDKSYLDRQMMCWDLTDPDWNHATNVQTVQNVLKEIIIKGRRTMGYGYVDFSGKPITLACGGTGDCAF